MKIVFLGFFLFYFIIVTCLLCMAAIDLIQRLIVAHVVNHWIKASLPAQCHRLPLKLSLVVLSHIVIDVTG